jgi:hypothetical protein
MHADLSVQCKVIKVKNQLRKEIIKEKESHKQLKVEKNKVKKIEKSSVTRT